MRSVLFLRVAALTIFVMTLLACVVGCGTPPEMRYINKVSATMATHPKGPTLWEVDDETDHDFVFVQLECADVEMLQSVVAWYWVNGQSVFTANEDAARLSPKLPKLDRAVPKMKFQKLAADTISKMPAGRLTWHIGDDKSSKATAILDFHGDDGSLKQAEYVIENGTVYAENEEAKALSPQLKVRSVENANPNK